MSDEATTAINPSTVPAPSVKKPPRAWPGIALMLIFWIGYAILRWTDAGINLGYTGFMLVVWGGLAVTLLFLLWWFAFSRARWAERFGVFIATILTAIVATKLADKSMGMHLVLPGIPAALGLWAAGYWLFRKSSPRTRFVAVMAFICLGYGAQLFLRAEGTRGDGQFVLHPRWIPAPEQLYLSEMQNTAPHQVVAASAASLTLHEGDWPGFRGADRTSISTGTRITTDWNTTPPKLLWKRRIGPAWSSLTIIGDHAFTQEQLGESEAVTCLSTATGQTIWSHQDAARHDDMMGGPGPRATPTFAGGQLYALGATGILNCLDAATGTVKWTRNILTDTGVKHPMWGCSGSPLVVGDLVIVFAPQEEGSSTTGDTDKTLLAYQVATGKPAWSAPAGKRSYSSPQAATIAGVPQILFVSERGLLSFDPATGSKLWERPTDPGTQGAPRCIQPRIVDANRILFDAGTDAGVCLVEVTHAQDHWSVKDLWISWQLKPAFNDFVVLSNDIYGFDSRVLTCVDLQTGQRLWKSGHYGSGQILLVQDQPVLVVISEKGEAAVVAADRTGQRELGRFQAITGKTWNHPVIAHGQLYVRNSEELACYDVNATPTTTHAH